MAEKHPGNDAFNEKFGKLLLDNDKFIATYESLASHLERAEERLKRAAQADKCRRESIDSFRILGTLGTGSFAKVVEAKYRDGTTVAMKIMQKSKLEKKQLQENAISERKLLTAMDNNFVTKLLFAFQDRRNVYLCLDYGYYGDLWECFVRDDQVLEENFVRLLAAQAVLAIRYLHACRIIHRDVKPGNLMLYQDGYLKLGDFGVAIKTDHQVTSLSGTPGYMAYEVVAQLPYDHGVDWFSLGATLFEMMFHRLPFCEYDEDPEEQMGNTLKKEVEFPLEYSNQARDFVSQLLQKRADNRLGVRKPGASGVMNHVWFRDIDFESLHQKKVPMKNFLPNFLTEREYETDEETLEDEDMCSRDDAFKEF